MPSFDKLVFVIHHLPLFTSFKETEEGDDALVFPHLMSDRSLIFGHSTVH